MFPMTPLQSWTFIALVLTLIVFSLWLVRALGDAFPARREQSEDQIPTLETRGRHLYIVSSRQDATDEEDPLAVWKDVLNP